MCTEAFKDEDFITSTIRDVDAYLAGEREDERKQLRTFIKHEGRLIHYETGVVAPDGYREMTSDWACWKCDRPAEYGGYCEAHYNEYLEALADDELVARDEWDTASMAEYEEWSREVSDASDAYFDVICGAHGDERDEDGLCPQCRQEIAEERRCDM